MRAAAKCGTHSGWSRHKAQGEQPCVACKAAKAAYDRARRQEPGEAARNRARSLAQSRALRDLKIAHPEEYRDLYKFHRAEVWEEHGLDGA